MKVYIVERQDCDDLFMEGVFSTFEKAENFCFAEFNDLYKHPNQNHGIGIGEFIIDEKE